jgi:hypothetical protein
VLTFCCSYARLMLFFFHEWFSTGNDVDMTVCGEEGRVLRRIIRRGKEEKLDYGVGGR